MKYLFYSILCFILVSISSCESKKSKLSVEAEEELDQLMEKKEKAYNEDKTKKIDSLSLIAWGDTKFGMTKQEVKASEAFKLEEQEKSAGLDMDYGDYYITGPKKGSLLRSLYNLNYSPEIKAYFKEDELYLVTIETLYRNAVKIKDLANDCGIFTKEFMKKYGEPEYLQTRPSILDFNNHQLKISSFSIGTKEIWVGLIEKDAEYKYYITIENKAFPKKKHIPTEEELRKQKEQEAKNKELRDNSF